MAPDQDPTRQTTLRKLRGFMGFLMNAEEALRTGPFDLAEAYRFALGEYDRLKALEDGAAMEGPAARRTRLREQTKVELELFRRFDEAIAFLQQRTPYHPLLPHYISYRARWRQCLGSAALERAGLEPSPDGPLSGEELFELPLDRLLHLNARLAAMPLPHEFAKSFILFLAGIHYAATHQRLRGRCPRHPEQDELTLMSQRCLDLALDFAMQAEPQALARTYAHLPADTAFHCLFMGIAFIQENLPAPVVDWLQQGRPEENRLRLFFGIGVKAASSRAARRLLRQVQFDLPRLTSQHVGPECGGWIEALGHGS